MFHESFVARESIRAKKELSNGTLFVFFGLVVVEISWTECWEKIQCVPVTVFFEVDDDDIMTSSLRLDNCHLTVLSSHYIGN